MRACCCYPRLVPKPPAHVVKCLKSAGLNSVWLIHRPGEEPRTLKSWPVTLGLLGKIMLGIAQPQRQIRGAKWVARAGVDPATVCGSWRFARREGRLLIELELDYVPGPSALDALEDQTLSQTELRCAAAAIGQIVAKLAVAGLFHRDLTLSNLIVRSASGPAQICVIDTVGVRRIRRPVPEIARMLERLGVQLVTIHNPAPPTAWMALLLEAMRPLCVSTARAATSPFSWRSRRMTLSSAGSVQARTLPS